MIFSFISTYHLSAWLNKTYINAPGRTIKKIILKIHKKKKGIGGK
jgi:hypothetical protein